MSKSIRRDWAQRYREQEQAAEMAAKELSSWLDRCTPEQKAGIDYLARWWEKWHLVAGRGMLGRLLLARAKIVKAG